jgi:V/A-type H+-transporting ATPase subunit C
MAELDYLNARVRGMSTALLSSGFFDQLLNSEGENILIDSFLNSTYEEELRSALTDKSGVDAISSAIRRQIANTFNRIRRIAPDEPRQLLNVQLSRWDMANVLAVIRGKINGATADEILEATLPVGELTDAQLAELAAETDLDAVANALLTWNFTFAFTVRNAIAESVGETEEESDLKALSLTLNRGYFEWALDQLRGRDEDTRTVRRQIQHQIDLFNIKSALDVVRQREKGYELADPELISGGTMRRRALTELTGVDNMESAFELLGKTPFQVAVERGILAYGETRNLAVMERFLEDVVIEKGCRLFRTDPLSIAVPLGYIWRQYNEFVNLRILVRGKRYQMPANAIREELLLV